MKCVVNVFEERHRLAVEHDVTGPGSALLRRRKQEEVCCVVDVDSWRADMVVAQRLDTWNILEPLADFGASF